MALQKGWYVLYVRHRHEIKVNKQLGEKDIETYLPLIKTLRKWKDRKKILNVPLFPSYIFVHIQSLNDLHRCLELKGACSFIKIGRQFARIQSKEIRQIKLLLCSEDVQDIHESYEKLKPGIKRVISIGPLTGLKCEVLGLNGKARVLIRIDSLDKNVKADIPIGYLGL